MFTQLKLHNFQNHRNLEIPLSKITTIIGESDTGKSAIVRAIQWLCLNSLQGDSFITHGRKKSYAILNVTNYGNIVRRRGSGINGYVLNDDEQRNAIGREVPADIAKILNIGEINIAAQHDPPFWFTLTASQLTKELNAIADIAWLDRVMQASNSNLRKTQTELDVVTARIASLETSLRESEYIETIDTDLQKLEKQDKDIQELKLQYEQLTDFVDRLNNYQKDVQTAKMVIHHFNQKIVPLYEQYAELNDTTGRITQFIESYPQITEETVTDLQTLQHNCQQFCSVKDNFDRLTELLSCPTEIPTLEIKQIQKQYQNMVDVHTHYEELSALLLTIPDKLPPSGDIAQLNKQITDIQTKQNAYDKLSGIIEQFTGALSGYKEFYSQVEQLETKLHEQLEGTCPICGQQM
jgi:chromosome segregation ATPase